VPASGGTVVLVVAAPVVDVVVGSAPEIVVDTFTDTGESPIGGVLPAITGNAAEALAETVGGSGTGSWTGGTEIVTGSVGVAEAVVPLPVDGVGPAGGWLGLPPCVPATPVVDAPVVGLAAPGVAAEGARGIGVRPVGELDADRRVAGCERVLESPRRATSSGVAASAIDETAPPCPDGARGSARAGAW
jgi:hypothetical protein